MSTPSEVVGTIIELDWDRSHEFLLMLRDTYGRLLSVTYHFENVKVAEALFKWLTKGMRVRLNVLGKVSASETIYKGMGAISIPIDRDALS